MARRGDGIYGRGGGRDVPPDEVEGAAAESLPRTPKNNRRPRKCR